MVRWVGSRNSPNVLNQEAKLPQPLKNATNSRHMETPVTISGLTMGKLVMFIMTFFGIRFMRLMPTAAMVPSTVEANAETTAMINVLSSASRI